MLKHLLYTPHDLKIFGYVLGGVNDLLSANIGLSIQALEQRYTGSRHLPVDAFLNYISMIFL